ncbi:MAG: hypothetical protein IIA83_09005 [Thaumarchaeota archaeon]|nr:hypothetical protein [Nitrososphaerota archaeon]
MKSEVLPSLIKKFSNLAKEIENGKFGPVNFFGRISRPIKFTAEILSWYNFVLGTKYYKPNPDSKGAFKDHQNRIASFIRTCFIEILSAIDYQSKEQLRTTTKPEFTKLKEKLEAGKYVIVSKIVATASNGNLITDEEAKYWNYSIYIRNCLVHNAGRTDKDFETSIGGIDVKKNEELEGKHAGFYELIEKTVSLYSNWIKIF